MGVYHGVQSLPYRISMSSRYLTHSINALKLPSPQAVLHVLVAVTGCTDLWP